MFFISKTRNKLISRRNRPNKHCCVFLLSLSLLYTHLQADISEFFKPALEKPTPSFLRGVDFIYMINLDERTEKWHLSLEQLIPYNIIPYRFSAVNGWTLPLDAFEKLGVRLAPGMSTDHMGTCYSIDNQGIGSHEMVNVLGKTYFCHCMSRGAIGIVLSHLSVLQDAYDSGYETIWVMEDDIQVIHNPHHLSDLIELLDKTVGKDQWDILFTDRDSKDSHGRYVPCASYAWRPNFTPDNPHKFIFRNKIGTCFLQLGSRYGAYSMILRRSGIKKMLDFMNMHHIFLPYDMEYYLPNDMQLYSLEYDVVSTLPGAPSDNGINNYYETIEK